MAMTMDQPASLFVRIPPSTGRILETFWLAKKSRHSNRAFGRRLAPGWIFGLSFLATLLIPARTSAQDNYEIQVYGYDLVDPGHTMVELHSNFTIDGSKETSDGVYPTNH